MVNRLEQEMIKDTNENELVKLMVDKTSVFSFKRQEKEKGLAIETNLFESKKFENACFKRD